MLKKKNFAKSTLASGITAAATQLTIATGEGTKFPSSGKFRAVLWAEAYINPSDDPNAEIVEAELSSGWHKPIYYFKHMDESRIHHRGIRHQQRFRQHDQLQVYADRRREIPVKRVR
jgi:hypothetical protein